MSVEAWISVGTFALLIIGIIVRVEQRMGKALTREEHERICMDRNTRVESQLDEIREATERRHEENAGRFDKLFEVIERNNEQATQARHRMADQIINLVEKVGSVQGRLGLDEFKRHGG